MKNQDFKEILLMLRQTARFVSLALLMFAASATPLTAKVVQQDGPLPQPPDPPLTAHEIRVTQQDGPLPQPPDPPLPHVTQVI